MYQQDSQESRRIRHYQGPLLYQKDGQWLTVYITEFWIKLTQPNECAHMLLGTLSFVIHLTKEYGTYYGYRYEPIATTY